jgi:hypothetical protein
MIRFIGTLTSPGWCMIGRWTSSPLSSMFCIPLEWVGRVMIDYVGRPQKRRSFEVKSFTRFFFLTLTPFPLEEHLED